MNGQTDTAQADVQVSQEEMDALLSTIKQTSDSRAREDLGDGRLQDVVGYDLVAARSVGGGQLPTLDLVNERFASLMAGAFSRMAKQRTQVVATSAGPVKFVECASKLNNPICLQIVELDGLRGTGILALDANLLFHLLDLLLGGNPSSVVDAGDILRRRGLTAVERRLFAHLTRVLAGELTAAWDGVAWLGMRPIRAETDPKHVALFEPGEMVVDAVFDVEVAGCEGQIHLIMPQSALKPIEKKLASGLLDSGGEDEAEAWQQPLTTLLREVTALTTAELGRTTLTLRDLLSLKKGEVIRLDREPDNPITVYVEGAPKMMGLPTLQHGNIAVEITSKVVAPARKSQTEGDDNG